MLLHNGVDGTQHCQVLLGPPAQGEPLPRVPAQVEYDRVVPMVPHISGGHILQPHSRAVVYPSSKLSLRGGPGPVVSLEEMLGVVLTVAVPCTAPSAQRREYSHGRRRQDDSWWAGSGRAERR